MMGLVVYYPVICLKVLQTVKVHLVVTNMIGRKNISITIIQILILVQILIVIVMMTGLTIKIRNVIVNMIVKNQALSRHVVEEDAASMQNVVAEEKTIVGESVTGKKKIHMVETQAIRNMTGEVKSHPINMMK
jgi:hypothetical protein